jgi:hypothetical protein
MPWGVPNANHISTARHVETNFRHIETLDSQEWSTPQLWRINAIHGVILLQGVAAKQRKKAKTMIG